MLKSDLDNYFHYGTYFQDESKHPAIQGKTFTIGDTFYIIFHASYGFWDYVTNFQFWRKRIEGSYRAHSGYVKRYNKLNAELIKRYVLSQCSSLHIIGYSMGASVALISAYYFSTITYPKVTCFEPLPICNKSLKNYLEESCCIHYTTFQDDIVTKLLPWNYHVGTEHHFGNPKKWWRLSAKDHPLGNIIASLQNY